MTLIQRHDGFWWPENDRHCHRVVHRCLKDLGDAFEHVTDWSIAVQAGGNVGVWPLHLAASFCLVHTFEPDPDNFCCLTRNAGVAANVMLHHAALGNADTRCAIDRLYHDNCGAHQVEYGSGDIPVVSIDSLGLTGCGLIQLDIEGAELEALQGAVETIDRFRPVIMVEIKGLGKRYGAPDLDIMSWIEGRGYELVKSPSRDQIYAARKAS